FGILYIWRGVLHSREGSNLGPQHTKLTKRRYPMLPRRTSFGPMFPKSIRKPQRQQYRHFAAARECLHSRDYFCCTSCRLAIHCPGSLVASTSERIPGDIGLALVFSFLTDAVEKVAINGSRPFTQKLHGRPLPMARFPAYIYPRSRHKPAWPVDRM